MEICRIAEAQVQAGASGTITRVGVVVGDDAGLERENLAFCLETLLTMPPFIGARAEILAARGDVLRVDYVEVDDARSGD